jgi:vacuolar-type H+-ATPase subunit I/STV1
MERADDPDAVQKLKAKLENLEESQEAMKLVNSYFREKGTLDGCPFLTAEQIEALTERLNAQPDTQPQEEAAAEEQQEQTPADKAAALVEKLAALDGVTATIKGAQTAAPVVWLTGEADAHKDEIEKLGGKWSGKRSAWYFKIA